MNEPAPIQLRRLDSDDATLVASVGQGCRAGFEIAGERADVELRIEDIPGKDANGVSLCLQTGAGLLDLRPGGAFMKFLSGIDIPAPGEADDDTRWIATQVAAAQVPEGWRRVFGVCSLQYGMNAPAGPTLILRLRMPGAPWSLAGRLSGQASTLLALVSAPEWTRLDAPPSALETDAIPVHLPIVLGRTRLALGALRALAPGDVVLADSQRFDVAGQGALRIGPWRMHGVLSWTPGDLQFQFKQWSRSMDDNEPDEEFSEDDLADDAPQAQPQPQPLAVQEIPLPLVFEVGTLCVTVGELAGLAPGGVLRLDKPLPPAVVIRCRGREVARGELVEIDGRLGVQVSQVELRDD
jgi:type III secretion protein Q